MALPIEIEEVRIASGDLCFGGRWEFPRAAVPPHPLAVLLPDRPSRDLDGAEPRRPLLRPFLELAWALVRRDIACFRYACPDRLAFVDALDAAWERGSRHPLASRQRVAMVMFGDGGATLAAERLSHWRAATEPLGAVLVAPRRMPDLSGLAGIHAHAILAGAADASPDPDALRAHADSASVPLGITVIDDLTEFLQAEADWLAGRPVPHPGLCAALADAVSDLLRPRWERDARPPGTAIGTA